MTHLLQSLAINTKDSNSMDNNIYLNDTSSTSSSPDSYTIDKSYSAFRDENSSSPESSDDEYLSPAYGII